MPIQSGSKLGPYEIIAQIGAGGMGEVYRAKDTRLDRTVAIKILPTHLSSNPDLKQRFEREARTISSLSHPHICALFDIGHQDGIDYLVMEFVEGETLADKLSKGALPMDQVLRYGMQISDALDKAHKQGIVHRDLKPGNIMIAKSGVKLLDFGLAKLQAPAQQLVSGISALPTEQRDLTAEGTIIGTLQYMSPEQLEGRESDARTDIFGMGLVLYEMATGRKAFTGKSQASLIAAILSSEPASISTIQPLSPPAFDRVVKTCLAKDPDDRWQTAHDVMLELKWIAEAGSQAGVPAPLTAKRRRRERIAWLFGVLAVLCAAVLGFFLFRLQQKPAPILKFSITAPSDVEIGVIHGIALSPDGRHIAFVARKAKENERLWVRSIDSLEARALEGTDHARFPFWSPDSRFLGFFADGKLKRIEPGGGSLQTICLSGRDSRGGTWNKNGVIVFVPDFRSGLYKVAASGGEPQALTQTNSQEGERSHRWPLFLPDGRHVLFVAQRAEKGAPKDPSTIDVFDLETGKRIRLMQANSQVFYSDSGHLLFWKEGTLYARAFHPGNLKLSESSIRVAQRVQYTGNEQAIFTASSNDLLVYQEEGTKPNRSELVWLDGKGNELGKINASPADYYDLTLSHDGKRIAYGKNNDIWIRDLKRGTETRFTFYEGDDYSPVWSPDDEWLYWSSDRKGAGDIYRKSSSGVGKDEELYSDKKDSLVVRDCSPDGEFLSVIVQRDQTEFDAVIFSIKNGELKNFVQTPFGEDDPLFSPDGQWMVYCSTESGRSEVYVRPISDSQKRWQVSTKGGDWPLWSPSGKEIYFTDSSELFVVKIEAGDNSQFEVGSPQKLFDLPVLDQDGPIYDMTADGRFAVIRPLEKKAAQEPLTVVYNWTAALE